MMIMLLVFSLAMWLGIASGEPEKRLLLDGNVEMNYDTEIALLKQQMVSQISEINQLRQQVSEISQLHQQISTLEQTKGKVLNVPERRLILDEMDNNAEITLLKQQVSQLVQEVSTLKQTKGATYVRWGRTTCDGVGTSTVYSGYTAGAYNDAETNGSGSDYLCLAGNPIWGHFTDTANNDILITGVEYDFSPHWSSDITYFFGSNIQGNQAPCAVCHVTRGASIMIPGRTMCYGNWTKEYDGYLVTGYSGYDDSTEYICLDKRPESIVGSGTAHVKNVMFFVEAKCGFDLECPPYENGREISCVVCSK